MLQKHRSCFLLGALLICIGVFLTGCHGKEGSPAFVLPESFDESKPIELSFWAKNDTNKTQTNIYEKAIKDFEALYPNVKISLRLYTDYGRIYNDVITNIATETTPNVCITYPDHIATYLSGDNRVVALDPLFDDENYGLGGKKLRFDAPKKDEIINKFLDECKITDGKTKANDAGNDATDSYDAHYYALPFMRSTEALYINKTLVEKLGYTIPEVLTWDFVWEVADAAMKTDEQGNYLLNGQKVMIPFIYKSTDNMMIQQLRQKEAGYSNENADILIFNDTTKELLETVADHVKKGAFSTFKISSYPGNFLNAGQCLFAVDSTAGATWMGTDAPLSDIAEEKIVEFETEVRMIPQFDPDNPKMISQGPSVCVFNKRDPQEVLAAWLFVQFLLTDEVQIAYSQTEGYVPVTTKARNTVEYQDYLLREGEDNQLHYEVKLKATKMLLANTENTFVTPVFNGSASLRDAAGQMIENTAKAVRRKQKVDDAFYDNLYDDMKALYRLDRVSTVKKGALEDEQSDESLGPLPTEAKVLLISLAVVWLLILVYLLGKRRKYLKK